MGGLFSRLFGSSKKEDPVIIALRSLGSTDDKIRQKAITELLKLGANIIPYLLAIIKSTQVEREWSAAQKMLGELDSSVKSGVLDLTHDLNSNNRDRIKSARNRLNALPHQGKELIEAIAQLEKAQDLAANQKKTAIGLLTQMTIPQPLFGQAVGALIGAIDYFNRDVRNSAENVLRSFGKPIEPYITEALKNPNFSGKTTLLGILKNLHPTQYETCKVLLGMLSDESISIRMPAIEIVGRMKDMAKDVIPVLIKLKTFNNDNKYIKEALGSLGPYDIDALLPGLSHSDARVRQTLVEILGEMGSKASGALNNLYTLLGDENDNVRASTARAIYSIKPDQKGIPALLNTLADENRCTSGYICSSLAYLGKSVIPMLIEKTRSDSNTMRDNAIHTLGLLTDNADEILPVLENLLDTLGNKTSGAVMDAIGKFGAKAKHLAPKLIDYYRKNGTMNTVYSLCAMEEPYAFDVLLRSAFDSPGSGNVGSAKNGLMKFINGNSITEKLIDLALKASTYDHKYSGTRYDAGYISLDASTAAIKELCSIKSTIVSNILHLVTRKKDISVTMDNGCSPSWTKVVSFDEQREMARKELSFRGNPGYDYTLYGN